MFRQYGSNIIKKERRGKKVEWPMSSQTIAQATGESQ